MNQSTNKSDNHLQEATLKPVHRGRAVRFVGWGRVKFQKHAADRNFLKTYSKGENSTGNVTTVRQQ